LEDHSRFGDLPQEVWGVDGLGTQEWIIDIAPREKQDWAILVGIAPTGEGSDFARVNANPSQLTEAEDEVMRRWIKRVRRFWVEAPDKDFTHLHQGWSTYQILIKSYLSSAPSYYHASDGSPGFRDSLQDAFALSMLEPERAREIILRTAAFQFTDGAASHRAPRIPIEVVPSEKSDIPLWIPLAVLQYIRETGDVSIIKEEVPFVDGPPASILDHIRLGLERSLADLGPHGLPLIHYGDWNDALDGLGGEGRGESVFLGQFLAFSLQLSSVIAELVDDRTHSQEWRIKAQDLIQILNDQCWDGDRFVRAFHKDGTIIGCRENLEGSLYLNPQAWAVIGNLTTLERQHTCMDTIERELDTRYGIRILTPPYSKYDSHVGLISCFPPGVKENGAIFSHAMAFALVAELMLKRAEKAWEIFCKANPVLRSRQVKEYAVEPHIYSQFVAGPETNLAGQGFHHWLTSACNWMQYAVVNWMLGARADVEGLIIDPCIPSQWKICRFTRPFRGTNIHVEIQNPDGLNHGVKTMFLDGELVPGDMVILPMEEEVQLQVIMG
jgi:cellobiose phosphorylase